MQKKILVVTAHPDDEAFGFGGTIAKYASIGVEIHVVCATRGEKGNGKGDLGKIREAELLRAADILGVTTVEFLNYTDGTLCNNFYHDVAAKIQRKIEEFKPQVVLTFDRGGVSGHLDHVFMSLVTTYVCRKFNKIKLFYVGEHQQVTSIFSTFYYIFFPPGLTQESIDVTIDISQEWKTKVLAMKQHKSQMSDVRKIVAIKRFVPKKEYYVAAFPKKTKTQTTDFFVY